MALRHAKTAQGKHYPVSLLKSTISLESKLEFYKTLIAK
jgi:hypothetical protein